MRSPRWVVGAAILLLGGGLILLLSLQKSGPPLRASLVPAFQLLGEAAKSVDVATAKMMPIDDSDEKDYGDRLGERYERFYGSHDKDTEYLNALLGLIASSSSKPFRYRAFINWEPSPNAFAFPGGVIIVTQDLLKTLRTEGELVSVLAHEMGHIECGHCFHAVRFELLARKMDISDVGALLDSLNDLFFRHSFSKTEEAEADAFAYKVILETVYSPSSVAAAFNSLQIYDKGRGGAGAAESFDLVRDYIASHPPLRLRTAKYDAEARRWWSSHAGQRRYTGRKNLSDRTAMSARIWDDEWTASAQSF